MNTSRICLSGLAAAGLMAAVSTPAHAVLQIAADVSGATFFCADNTGCDLNPAVGIIQLANGTLNGVAVNGSIQASTGTPANPGQDLIDTSSLSIINTVRRDKGRHHCGRRHRLLCSGHEFPYHGLWHVGKCRRLEPPPEVVMTIRRTPRAPTTRSTLPARCLAASPAQAPVHCRASPSTTAERCPTAAHSR